MPLAVCVADAAGLRDVCLEEKLPQGLAGAGGPPRALQAPKPHPEPRTAAATPSRHGPPSHPDACPRPADRAAAQGSSCLGP